MNSRFGSGIVLNRLLMFVILAAAFSLGAVTVMYFALSGRTVIVPDVIGKTEENAESELDDYGLRMVVKSRIHDDKIPSNAICDQYPPAGTVVKTGQLVRVSLSLGADRSSE